jgi:hypothetical protein
VTFHLVHTTLLHAPKCKNISPTLGLIIHCDTRSNATPCEQCCYLVLSMLSYDRRSVGQSILVSGHHLGPATNFSFTSMVIIFIHLWFSSYGEPSLTRGRIRNLLVQVPHEETSQKTRFFEFISVYENV